MALGKEEFLVEIWCGGGIIANQVITGENNREEISSLIVMPRQNALKIASPDKLSSRELP